LASNAQELGGRIKRNTGEVAGDRRLQSEGSADEFTGNLNQAGEKIKDAFAGVALAVAVPPAFRS